MQNAVENHGKPSSKENLISTKTPERNEQMEWAVKSSSPTRSLQIESAVPPRTQTEATVMDEWNAIAPIALGGEESGETTLAQNVKTVYTLEKSFTAMVMAFLIACLDIFSSIQKAQMTMALQQLDAMKSQIKLQIEELKKEQTDQLFKDCFQAATEMAGSIIAAVGSAKTTFEMGQKLNLQKNNIENMKGAMVNEKIDKLQKSINNETALARNKARAGNGVPDDTLKSTHRVIDELSDGTKRVKTEVGNINSDAPLRDVNTYKTNGEMLASDVHLLNNKQSLLNSISSLAKAFGPIVGASFNNQATGHQIKAKEAETAQGVTSNQYRIYMENLSAYRDAFSKMISSLQEVLNQGPANSKASSQRMA